MKILQEYWASTVIFIGIFSQFTQRGIDVVERTMFFFSFIFVQIEIPCISKGFWVTEYEYKVKI